MTSKNNTGGCSTGPCSTGDYSTGDYSTGDWSTGDYSTGHRSTGDYSTGDYSTGDRSTGHCSTGDWSTTDYDTGHFNTTNPTTINVFNKPCDIKTWGEAIKPSFLYFELTEWVWEKDMSDSEKVANPTFCTTGGYLKVCDYQEAFQASYNKASDEDKELLLKLPNFDAEVFKEISGIDVTKDTISCAGKIVVIDGKKYKLQEVK